MMNAMVLLICALTVLTACHGDSGESPATQPAVRAAAPVLSRKGPTPEELTVGMVQAVSQGKSQVPVELKFDLSQRPATGKAVDIDIAVVPQISADQATVQISGSDGLDIAPDSRQVDFQSVESAQVYRRKIRVTPAADGIFFLVLTVTLNHDQITESRVFSVPVLVESTQSIAADAKH